MEKQEKNPKTNFSESKVDKKNADLYANAIKNAAKHFTEELPDDLYLNRSDNRENNTLSYLSGLFNTPKMQIGKQHNTKNYMSKSQSWTGYVVNIDKDCFTAKLFDNKEEGTFEIADFDKLEVSPEDLSLLSKGAVFYWTVGFDYENGQASRKSIIKFKRSVPYPSKSYDKAADRASDYDTGINWD